MDQKQGAWVVVTRMQTSISNNIFLFQSIPPPRSRTLLNELQNIMCIFLNCLPRLEFANFNDTVWNI